MIKMKLTELEKDVIVAITENEYSDVPGDPVWSFSIDYNTKITKKNQISGVVSSLVKKGLVVSQGWDKDDVVYLTKKGIDEYHKLKVKK